MASHPDTPDMPFDTQPVTVQMWRSTDIAAPVKPTISPQLRLRRATVEEAGALAGMLGRAYPSEIWEEEATVAELFEDPSVKATMVLDLNGRIVATASLQVRPDSLDSGQLGYGQDESRKDGFGQHGFGQDGFGQHGFGQIRWVATEPDWRRQGLAKLLVVVLLELANDESCQETRLKTTSDLTGAIALYLQLGFEPLLIDDADRDVWQHLYKVVSANSSS